MSSAGQTPISFTEQDLALFSQASGDRNPLHLSSEYARSTAYGQPVVFGCLGALAALGHIHLPAGWSVTSLEAEFLRPMFLSVEYRIETSEKEGKWGARLFDGSIHTLSVSVTAEISHRTETPPETVAGPAFEHTESVARRLEEIVPGLKVAGLYACSPAALVALAARWGVADRLLLSLLSFSSYLVGMEIPGESALFSKLVLRIPATVLPPAALRYQASVVSVNTRLGQIKLDISLLSGPSIVASGQYWSFVRPPIPEVEEIDSVGVRPDSLAGRACVLLGSSRGLGASIKRALELRGAAVYGMARSAHALGQSRTGVGDAADPDALRRLRERVLTEQGRLDFLICNACPPILPLRLEPSAAGRIAEYISQAIALTLAPLAEFSDLLNRSEGCVVIISSAAVDHPVREWPHYIAAKQAVEALGCIASLQFPRVRTLIVRPPKLLTSLTNTPMGRLGASSPALLANRIATRLEDPPEPGRTEILC